MGILFLPARQGRCSGLLFCSAVRPLLLLRLRLRPIPTSDTDTLVVTEASSATVDTEDMVLATPALDTLDLVTLVATDSVTEVTPVVTTASARLRLSPRLMLRLIPTSDTDTLVATPALDTLVDTEDMVLDTLVDTDLVTEATPVVTTASARLRLSPRLMLMLRLIPTSDTDTLVATDS